VRALGAQPLQPHSSGVARDHTYSWLGGLVRGRLDRCYVFAPPPVPSAPAAGRADPLGIEAACHVVRTLPDVSDHWPIRITLEP
jgi:hypothetical protein